MNPLTRIFRPPEEHHIHTVQHEGETLAGISLWYTGSSRNWRDILDSNPGLDIRRIQIGDTIRIPEHLVRRRTALPARYARIGGRRYSRAALRAPASDARPASGSAATVINPASSAPSPSVEAVSDRAGDHGAVGNVSTNLAAHPAPVGDSRETLDEDLVRERLLDAVLAVRCSSADTKAGECVKE